MEARDVRQVDASEIEEAVYGLFRKAGVAPTAEVRSAVERAAEVEGCRHAREILRQLAENNRIALEEGIPACQDTGMAIVFLDVGQDVHVAGGLLEEAVSAGVRRAYADGCFRMSVLDPLSRENTEDNLPAILHERLVPGDRVRITAVPKGFGSENMSRIAMLPPSAGRQGVVDFVVDAAENAGGSPCPPVVLGIGIGGSFEQCAMLSKRALLERLDAPNPDPQLAEMEREMRERINALGMGPMGMGGDTYCLRARILKAPTHIAALPVAVNFSCHMLRHETAVI